MLELSDSIKQISLVQPNAKIERSQFNATLALHTYASKILSNLKGTIAELPGLTNSERSAGLFPPAMARDLITKGHRSNFNDSPDDYFPVYAQRDRASVGQRFCAPSPSRQSSPGIYTSARVKVPRKERTHAPHILARATYIRIGGIDRSHAHTV